MDSRQPWVPMSYPVAERLEFRASVRGDILQAVTYMVHYNNPVWSAPLVATYNFKKNMEDRLKRYGWF